MKKARQLENLGVDFQTALSKISRTIIDKPIANPNKKKKKEDNQKGEKENRPS